MLIFFFISLAIVTILALFGNWNYRHACRSARDLVHLCQNDEG